MAWRWYKRLRLFGGLNANLSRNGVGWSWGLGTIRYGVSGSGRRWVSIGIPGTGVRYLKYLHYNHPNQIEDEAVIEEQPEQQTRQIRKWKNIK